MSDRSRPVDGGGQVLNLSYFTCSSAWPPPASQVFMKLLAVLSLIAVAAAESLLTHHTSQIPPITSEWQRPDWTAALIQAKDYLKGFNITEKIILATGVGWQNGLSSCLRA